MSRAKINRIAKKVNLKKKRKIEVSYDTWVKINDLKASFGFKSYEAFINFIIRDTYTTFENDKFKKLIEEHLNIRKIPYKWNKYGCLIIPNKSVGETSYGLISLREVANEYGIEYVLENMVKEHQRL